MIGSESTGLMGGLPVSRNMVGFLHFLFLETHGRVGGESMHVVLVCGQVDTWWGTVIHLTLKLLLSQTAMAWIQYSALNWEHVDVFEDACTGKLRV